MRTVSHLANPEGPTGHHTDRGLVIDGLLIVDPAVVVDCDGLEPSEIGRQAQRFLDLGVAASHLANGEADLRRLEDATRRVQETVTGHVDEAIVKLGESIGTLADPDGGPLAETMRTEVDRLVGVLVETIGSDDAGLVAEIRAVVTGAITEAVTQTVSPLRAVFDDSTDDGPMGRLRRQIAGDLTGPMRDLAARIGGIETHLQVTAAVDAEAAKGTAKGASYEEAVGDVLRAQMPHTDVVTHTGVTEGDIPGCKVGDHVVDADFGHTRVRVTYEAKDRGSFTEPAARKELDEAADNRRAAVAVLVLSRPHKVLGKVPITKLGPGRWAVLYNDDVGSLPLEVVYQSARLEAAALADDAGDLDPAAVASLIDEATRALSDATNIRRSITKAEKAVDEVRSGVDALVERVDDVLDRMRDLAA